MLLRVRESTAYSGSKMQSPIKYLFCVFVFHFVVRFIATTWIIHRSTYLKTLKTYLSHYMFPHSKPFFFHFYHIILFIFGVIYFLQLKRKILNQHKRKKDNKRKKRESKITKYLMNSFTSLVNRASNSCSSRKPSLLTSKVPNAKNWF